MLRAANLALGVAAGLAGVVGLAEYLHRRDSAATIARLEAGSRVAETRLGPIEYAVSGEGPAVLVLHGAMGGYDHGLLIGVLLPGFRIIAPSRFGYLRSPLPDDPSHEAQADRYAALLDVLGIERAAVVGISAGGPSAIQFALRHPDRCSALGLISAISQPPRAPTTPALRLLLETMLRADLLFWLLMTLDIDRLVAINGLTADEQLAASAPAQRELMRAISRTAPLRLRRAGLINDLLSEHDMSGWELGHIRVPTLVAHGDTDPLVHTDNGRHSASAIPGAELLLLPNSGHMAVVTRQEAILPALRRVLGSVEF
ncbi:MAG TPA: alpha/beta hydrolase [Roseiflexaceae bacterium]|nr:alpha/beta hydrolase [Roseiflexaceae bacterium]